MPTFLLRIPSETPFPDGTSYSNTARVSFDAPDLNAAAEQLRAALGATSVTWDFLPEMIPPPIDPDAPPPVPEAPPAAPDEGAPEAGTAPAPDEPSGEETPQP